MVSYSSVMNQTTPNQEHIESFIDDIEERYQYDKLKDCSLDYLHEQKHLIKNEFDRFEWNFPSQTSQAPREFQTIMSSHQEPREPLSTVEKRQLEDTKKTALREIHRARGYRNDKKREHRLDLINSVSDFAAHLRSISPV